MADVGGCGKVRAGWGMPGAVNGRGQGACLDGRCLYSVCNNFTALCKLNMALAEIQAGGGIDLRNPLFMRAVSGGGNNAT